MATIVFGAALSHSPMMNLPIPKDHDKVERFKNAVAQLSSLLHAAKPDVLVIFGPDHFRTLFYDLMPAFVIGVERVAGWGDWNTPQGPFPTHKDLANHIVRAALAESFDAAFSYEIRVDHGTTQPLELMELTQMPLVPIVVNCAGPPFPTTERCYNFGAAVGRAISSFPESLRVAVVASGGLSHDPPAPSPENALHGRTNGFSSDREREMKLMKLADKLQSRINTRWDHDVLDAFKGADVEKLAGRLTSESILADAGRGGQEVRTWIAMAGAMGNRVMRVLCYEPIDALITGMGVIST